jgi:hypothetical protein
MRAALAAAVLGALFLAAYLPDLGHGFIRDDFRWVHVSRSGDFGELLALFSTNLGFYRPLVSVSFAADYAIWGLNPFGYGITNLTLCLLDSVLLFCLARRFALPATAALFTAALWAFNFHGINMALLWLSGRTALLVALFTLSAAHAVLRRWRLAAGLLCLTAMLCKEEAVVLPALLTGFILLDRLQAGERPRPLETLVRAWPLWAALPLYAVLRMGSGAFGVTNAPAYYQFSGSPALLLRNLAEYTDRTATLAIAVVVVLLLFCGWRNSFSGEERRTLLFSALWVPATYALTMFLPIRSSLYAVLPSIGTSLAAGAFASRAMRANPVRFRQVAVALIVVAGLLIPVYRARNERWAGLGRLSGRVMQTLGTVVPRGAPADTIVFVDNPNERFTLSGVFDSAFADALALALGEGWTGEIVSAGSPPPSGAYTFRLINGQLVTAVSR